MTLLTLVASVAVFGLLILAHEFGHFLAAKRAGVTVREFSIGFGPRLGGWERGGTVYSLRLFPLGGFNLMAGMDPDEPVTEGSFNAKSLGQRVTIVAAGPLMNFLLTALLFSLMFAIFGLPYQANLDSAAIGQVIPGYPAEKAGLEPGDVVVSIDGDEIRTWADLSVRTGRSLGRSITVVVRRGEELRTFVVTPVADPEEPGAGIIGVTPTLLFRRIGPIESVAQGLSETWRVLVAWLSGLVGLFLQRAPADLAGPVMTVRFIGATAKSGLANLMYLAGFLSLNIGLFNLIPFPALDGGRLTFLAYEGITRRKVDPHKESLVHFVGFATLILLIILVTYQDILRL
ncbi:MAG: M50 family metallopeptidase [Bacillota bacterium]